MHPMMRDRRGGVGRLVWWVFWVVLIVYVVHNPSEAAASARALAAWLERLADSVITFFQQAAGGAR